jgi:hypothetical protein
MVLPVSQSVINFPAAVTAGIFVIFSAAMKLRILLFVAGLALAVTAVHAHHSIAGAYDSKREVTVEGMVAEFQFVNPHPYITVAVKTSSGGLEQWKLEMDNRGELTDVGMTKDTLKPGDRIVVSGNPANAQPQSLYIRKLVRPADGFRYEQVGNSPKIIVKPR